MIDPVAELAARPERATVLVVDDQPANIQALYRTLSPEHQVIIAIDGQRALELCVSARPDLVLLDVEMPGLDGYEVCRRIKADPATQDIAVIFVTGRSESADITHGFDLGAVDFITKPILPPVVKARVKTHLTLKQQADQLRRMAWIDGLTGVPNRRAFDVRLVQEYKRAARAGEPLALLMVDIDGFKLFNDCYGHQSGDECLRQVARCLAAQMARPGDLAARFGGEEFVCLLPQTDARGAFEVAERAERAVRSLGIAHAGSSVATVVTVSIGVAALWPWPEGDARALVAAADAQLYRAKSEGRGRVCLAFDDGAHADHVQPVAPPDSPGRT